MTVTRDVDIYEKVEIDALLAERDATLAATFVAAELPTVRRWLFLGDSITNGSSAANFAYSMAPQAAYAAGHTIVARGFVEAGALGETSAQRLTALPDLLTAYTPAGVHVQVGTNDVGQGVPLATFQANMTAIATLLRARGIPFTVGTIPPVGSGVTSASARAATTAAFNTWLRTWAPSVGAQLADIAAVLVDTTTGHLASAYDGGDGIHPSTLGHARMGRVIGAAIRRAATAAHVVTTKGAGNIITNPLIGSVASGNPSNTFGVTSTGVSPTAAIVADVSGELEAGNWAELTIDASGGASTFARAFSCSATGADTWGVGDTIILTGMVQIEVVSGDWEALAAAGAASWELGAYNGATGVVFRQSNGARSIGRRTSAGIYTVGPVMAAGVITSGSTSIAVRYGYTVPSGCSMKFRFGEVGVFNATKQSLITTLDGEPTLVD